MARQLTKQQQAAVEQFRALKVGALFMGMGTGKTQTAVSIVNEIDGIDYLLWVCPCQTKANLRRELALCGSRYDPDIVGVESIGQSDRIYLEYLHKCQEHKSVCLVVDESIKIKNIRAKRTKRLNEMANFSEYRLILNGSPITRNIVDIYAQMRFLSPKILDTTWSRYRDTYCSYKQYKKNGRPYKTVITGTANIDHLMSLIHPYVYQCDLEIAPKKLYSVRYWCMSSEEHGDYIRLKRELFAKAEQDAEHRGDPDAYILGIFQKLQHSYCCCEAKFREIEGLVNSKTILFCRFKKSEDELKKRYPDTLVLTYGKGSFGLNLQAYNRIIYFDKTWDYAFREQSEARTYRTGQSEDCEYIDLTGDVGLEELMDNCIDKKMSLVQLFKEKGAEAVLKDLEDYDAAHRSLS